MTACIFAIYCWRYFWWTRYWSQLSFRFVTFVIFIKQICCTKHVFSISRKWHATDTSSSIEISFEHNVSHSLLKSQNVQNVSKKSNASERALIIIKPLFYLFCWNYCCELVFRVKVNIFLLFSNTVSIFHLTTVYGVPQQIYVKRFLPFDQR